MRLKVVSLLLFMLVPCFAGDKATGMKFQMLKAIPVYMEWPVGKKPKQMRICILSDKNPFKEEMKAFAPQKIRGKELIIFHSETWSPLPEAEIYYFDIEAEAIATRLARSLKGKPVIRVSSIPNFSNRGGDIHFHSNVTKTFLEVNRESLAGQGLVTRSRLLRLSKPEVKK